MCSRLAVGSALDLLSPPLLTYCESVPTDRPIEEALREEYGLEFVVEEPHFLVEEPHFVAGAPRSVIGWYPHLSFACLFSSSNCRGTAFLLFCRSSCRRGSWSFQVVAENPEPGAKDLGNVGQNSRPKFCADR